MLPSFIHDPFEPCPPPDRRWQRAGYILDRGAAFGAAGDDDWVARALTHRRAAAAAIDDAQRVAAAGRDPQVAQAAALHVAEPALLRAAVEARILAGEPFPAIDHKCGLLEGTAATYEALHFAVAHRLDCADWIAATLLIPAWREGWDGDYRPGFWRQIGYDLGPIALDLVIHGHLAAGHVADVADTVPALDDWARAAWRCRELAAVFAVPVTPKNAGVVLRLANRLKSAPEPQGDAADAKTVDTLPTPTAEAAQQLLDELCRAAPIGHSDRVPLRAAG